MGRHHHRRDGAVRSLLAGTTPAHRRGFIFWQFLGIADLVNALALGTLSGIIDPHGISTAPMTVLPMSYIHDVCRASVSDPAHHLYRAGAPLAGDSFCCTRPRARIEKHSF